MGLWDTLFGKKQKPGLSSIRDERFAAFLFGWECELRSRLAPSESLLDDAEERFFEHFPSDFDEAAASRLVGELRAWTTQFLETESAAEAAWTEATANDRLSAAFEALRLTDLVAIEDAGVSIQDGWGSVGLAQRSNHLGAVFFHQQDILDTLRGEALLLAFGSFEERVNPPAAEVIGRQVVEALSAAGLEPSWSGDAAHRIRLPGFRWQKRRWTPSPEVAVDSVRAPAPSTFDARELSDGAVERLTQSVTAVRSSHGFFVALADAFAAHWRKGGGVRGQLCHVGPPHIFVRAGEQTELGVRNAFLNLAPTEASAVRRRARGHVIQKERDKAVRAVPWPRPLWAHGGGPGRVALIVVSPTPLPELAADDAPVDLTAWSPTPTLPENFDVKLKARASQPDLFSSLLATARRAHEQTSTGPTQQVLSLLEAAQHGAVVSLFAEDPADLGYLQFGWAAAWWLLERGDGVVLDTLSGRWWTRKDLSDWEAGGWPTGRRFNLEREVMFISGAEGDHWALMTNGLCKFGRPELLVHVPAENIDATFSRATIPGWGPEVLSVFATKLAFGAQLTPGERVSWGSLSFEVQQRPGEVPGLALRVVE